MGQKNLLLNKDIEKYEEEKRKTEFFKEQLIELSDKEEFNKINKINKIIKNNISDISVDDEEDDEPDFAKGVNYASFSINYHKEVLVSGVINEWLSPNQTVEYRNHLSSSYGSGGSYSTKEELQELKESILNFFKNRFKIPYVEFGKLDEKLYGHYICDIKSENIRLSISENAKEYLKRNNFSLDELIAQTEDMRKNRTKFTKEYQDKMEMHIDVDKFADETESEIKDLVDVILENGKTLKSVVDITKIFEKIDDLIEQLKDVDDEYSKLHKFFFGWDRHTFVSKEDEEWFWERYKRAKKIVFGDKIDK